MAQLVTATPGLPTRRDDVVEESHIVRSVSSPAEFSDYHGEPLFHKPLTIPLRLSCCPARVYG